MIVNTSFLKGLYSINKLIGLKNINNSSVWHNTISSVVAIQTLIDEAVGDKLIGCSIILSYTLILL